MTKRIAFCTCDEECPIHGSGPGERSESLIVNRILLYGKERFEPVSEQARKFAALLDQVLLTTDDIERIKGLGFRVETKGKVL